MNMTPSKNEILDKLIIMNADGVFQTALKGV